MKNLKWLPVFGVFIRGYKLDEKPTRQFVNDFAALQYYVFQFVCILAFSVMVLNIFTMIKYF